jgi:HK97 gp10 family phage protein
VAYAIAGTVAGLEELKAVLADVDRRVRKQALQKAIRAAANVVLRKAKANVRRRSGLLARSLGVKVKTYRGDKQGGAVVAVIGPRKGYRQQVGTYARGPKKGQPKYENPTQVAHLIEKGHGGPHPARAYPFLRPALDTSRGEVLEAVAKAVQAELHK